jgi:hypothetical protein
LSQKASKGKEMKGEPPQTLQILGLTHEDLEEAAVIETLLLFAFCRCPFFRAGGAVYSQTATMLCGI